MKNSSIKRSIWQWLGQLLKRGKKPPRSAPAQVRLDLECLEDRTLPSLSVLSINGAAPASLITNATSVAYTVTFNEPAFGVNPTDFQVVTSGTVATTLTQVTPPSGSVYTVTISGITGNGSLGLNLVNNGTIQDSSGAGLSNSSFTGQVYTIDTIAPFVQSINRTNPAGPNTTATSVAYTVTFSEAVTSVNAADFHLVTSGSLGTALTQVTPVSSSIYTVTVSGITGNGTLGLNLVDNGSIRDLAGNPLVQPNAPVTFQSLRTFAGGSYSLTLGDVNGDGKPDIVEVNRGKNTVSVLLNNGNGTFQAQQMFPTGPRPYSVALGDLTGDGNLDIVVANEGNNTVSVLLGNGNGTFQAQQQFATGRAPKSVAVGDVNGDGKPDLVVANYASNTVGVLLGNGNGSFQAQQQFATSVEPISVALADVNGDGEPDLVVTNYRSNTVSVLLGNGNGTFQAQQTFSVGPFPYSVAVGDVNGDGKPDLVVANYRSKAVSVLVGNGNGSFQAPLSLATGGVPGSVVLADVNGDGKPDLVVADTEGLSSVSILLGNGNGTFLAPQTFPAGSFPFSVAVRDVNGDGKPDIVVANPGNDTVSVLLNNGNGNFTGPLYTIRTTPFFVVSMPASITAGSAAAVTVIAYDAAGNILTAYRGTVHFTASDFGAGSALPVDYIFVGADNGSHVFPISLVTAGNQTVTATDSVTGGITGSATATVSGATAQTLTLTAPATATEGTAFAITVTAKDNFGNIAPGYTGTVSFTSTDPASQPPLVLPAPYTFTPSDQGEHIFSFGVTLVTVGSGSQTIMASDNNGFTSSATVHLGPLTPWPIVQSIDRTNPTGPITSATSVAYTVTFSEPVTGVSTADFQVVTSGSVGTLLTQVTPVSSSIYTVTISGITGIGTLGLNVVDNGSIHDLAGNTLTQQNAPAAFQTQQTFGTDGYPRSVAVADVNGDGKPDLIVANQASNTVSVLLGNGNGTFQVQQTFATGTYPWSVAVGDVNGDGKPDIVAANWSDATVSVLLGNGNGTFQAQRTFATVRFPFSVTVGDVNGDGKPDLVATGPVSVLLGNGDGTFQAQQTFATGGEADSMAVGDVNGDGKPDIVVANFADGTVSVLLGNGNGTFQAQQTFATGQAPNSVAIGDVNGDGKPDIVVSNELYSTGSVLLGNGNGTFQTQRTIATGSFPASVVVGDVNGDGKPDLVVLNNSGYFAGTARPPGTVCVLLGNGNGTFQAQQTFATGYLPGSLALADVNGDGKPDIVVANLVGNTVSVLLNNTNGNFTGQIYTITGPTVTHFALTGLPSTSTTGASVTFTVTALDQFGNTAPTYSGTVHFTSSDGNANLPADATLAAGTGVFSAQLTTAGSQTLTAADTSTNAIAPATASITVNPGTANHFAISAPSSATTGTAFILSVVAQDQFYNTVTGYTGTVHFTSSDKIAQLPADAPLTSGVGTFSAILNTLGNQTITAYDTVSNTITGRTASVAVTGAVSHFAVAAPTATAAGAPFTVVVTALDQSNNLVPSYTGLIRFTSTDLQAILPPNATLTNGVGFFAAGFETAGSQTITVSDTANQRTTGTSGPVSVSPLNATHFAVSAPPGAITGVSFQFTVTALDLFDNIATGYSGTVHFTSTAAAASLPGNSTLTAGQGIFSATLKTEGIQSLSATDTAAPTLTGTSNNIATLGLIVTSLTPTPTGFVAVFSKPFDPSTINLYDTSGTFGPDDVLLTGPGAPQTSIHGSLIIDPSNQTITFVKTSTFTSNVNSFNPQTGLLTAGTYAVTFRSATNGFVDMLGDPLDGASSGNLVGSNFTTTFVVAATPTEVVGIPGFARGPNSAATINLPNNLAFGIPLNLSTGAGVTAGKFTLQYNSALLSITGVAVNSSLTGATLTLDPTSMAGSAVIDFSSPTALSAGPVRLGGLAATVPNSAAPLYTDKALLHWSSVSINGGLIAAAGDDSVDVNAYFGDVNGAGTLSSIDAALISRVAIGADNNPVTGVLGGFAAFRLADPVLLADLSAAGSVGASDVTLMNSLLAGTPRAQIPAIPSNLSIPMNGVDPALSIPTNLQAAPGGTVVVPVQIDSGRPTGSMGITEAILALQFDPSVFTTSAADIQLGSLLSNSFATNEESAGSQFTLSPLHPVTLSSPGWQLQTAINDQTGQIGIDLFSTTPMQTTAGGTLVTITFLVRENALAGRAGINLVPAVNPTGSRPFVTTVSDAQGGMVLHLTETALGPMPGAPGEVMVGTDPFVVGQFIARSQTDQSAMTGGMLAVNNKEDSASALSTFHFPLATALVMEPSQDSTLGQPGAILNSNLGDQTESGGNEQSLLPLGTAQHDWIPADLAAYFGQTAKAGRWSPLGDFLNGGAEEQENAELAGVEDFFALEAMKRGQ